MGNLSLAGVAFLFLAQLPAHGSVFLNEITALYTAFLAAQSIVLIFGERATPISNTSQVAFIMGICGSFVICASFSEPGLLRLAFCCGIGLTYSLMLSGVQKVVTAKLRGPGFIQYAGWSQTLGKFTSFAITALLGLAMSKGFSSSTLLTLSGVLGIISTALLMLTPVRITQSLIDIRQT